MHLPFHISSVYHKIMADSILYHATLLDSGGGKGLIGKYEDDSKDNPYTKAPYYSLTLIIST